MTRKRCCSRNIVYFAEGETEVKLLEVLKLELRSIYPGKVRKCNTVQELLKPSEFIQYGIAVSIVLIFDTDTGNAEILKTNIKCVSGLPNCREVICIPQVRNLEDELKYACGLKDIREITGSRSVGNFKRDFLRLKNTGQALQRVGFDVSLIWSRSASGVFSGIENGAEKIKRRV